MWSELQDDFTSFVSERGRALERLAYVLTGNQDQAADLVQTVLIKVWRGWRRITALDNRDAYIRRMLLSAYLDGRRRRSTGEVATGLDLDGSGHSSSRDPAQLVGDRDELRRALSTLSPQQRAVVALRFLGQLADDEIAHTLQCSAATVRSHAAAARRRLLATLTAEATPEWLP